MNNFTDTVTATGSKTKRDSKFQDVAVLNAYFDSMNGNLDPDPPALGETVSLPSLDRRKSDKSFFASTEPPAPPIQLSWPSVPNHSTSAETRSISSAAEVPNAVGDPDDTLPPGEHPPVPPRKQSRGLSVAKLNELLESIRPETMMGLIETFAAGNENDTSGEEGTINGREDKAASEGQTGEDPRDFDASGMHVKEIVRHFEEPSVHFHLVSPADFHKHPAAGMQRKDEADQGDVRGNKDLGGLQWRESPLHSPIISISPPATTSPSLAPEAIVNMSSMHLTTAPTLLVNTDRILELRLSDNNLTDLPPALLKDLPQLQILDISKNMLEEVPKTIGECKKLTQLVLADNRLKVLPGEIGTLHKLTTLDVQRNDLVDLGK
ncbi:hypothetical protein HDV00_001511 [Rhizophlyctis rosea]|nr:hypothetical protein HDV00_001511 [Rhizophlyctis rosea]